MGCCGQNRAVFATHRESQPSNALSSVEAASLRFVQSRSIMVRGPLTGRSYKFHRGAYTNGIDARDASALLKSGYFETSAG